MYSRDIYNISPNYTKEDLKALFLKDHLSAYSDHDVFSRAVEMFRDRIQGRFFDQIDRLAADGIEKNGFAIMALECLLVETLAQFENGRSDSCDCSAKVYTEFLRKRDPAFNQKPNIENFPSPEIYDKEVFHNRRGKPIVKPNDNAMFFYNRIRCGILHQAQSGNNSALAVDGSDQCVFWHDNYFMVHVGKFMEMMESYFYQYIDELYDSKNIVSREKFVRKMRYICKLQE